MRWLLWSLLLGVPLAVATAALREAAPWAPLLPWAVVAWMVAGGDDDALPWRALVAGLVVDAVDPAAGGFHAIAMVLAAGAARLLRPWLFPGATTVAGSALAGGLVIELADQVLGGSGARSTAAAVAAAVLAAPAAVLLGWLLDALPGWAHPLARRPRTAPA
ncbi:MAG: hypothetical protein RLZZ127_2926 [Planctomycetota bacterium]|jgi:hypothetical protein